MYRKFALVTLLFTQLMFAQETPKEEEQPKALEEVVVQKENKTFTNKNGNIKVDVANSILSNAPSVIDLLEKLPKVIVAPDKQSLSIIGKGSPLLYIDNQKADMNDINSLAMEDIKTIEIINNPSAKYEASGRAVILITRKFSKREGYKVSLTENVAFKKYFNNYSAVNANLKTGSLEFKANFNYNQIKVWESNGNTFSIPAFDIESQYLVTAVTDRPQFIYGGGLFYKINEDDYLSVNFSRTAQDDDFAITTDTFNRDGIEINSINTLNTNTENRNHTNAFLNYNHKIKSLGVDLFTGLQLTSFNQQMEGMISNDFNDVGYELAQFRNQRFGIDVASGRIDIEKTFKNEMKLELGGLYLQAKANTFFEVITANPPAANQSIYFHKEKNIAAYTQFSGTYKKLNYTLGLRAENTIVDGKYQAATEPTVAKNFINLFPKAQFEVVIDSSNTVSLNYAKTIARPDYSSTSQTSTYINPYFVWSDNINLNPTFTDEIALGYQYKDKSIRLAYYKITNPVYYSASYDNNQKLLTFTSKNFELETNLNLELTLPFKYKFWTTMNVFSASINSIEDESALINKAKPNLYYYSNHIFTLPKKMELYFTAWGITKQQLGIFERTPIFTMNAAFSKTFHKNLICSISWNDILKKITIRENFVINEVSSKGVYFTDSHSVLLTLKYSFGQIKKSDYKEKSIDDNSGRIK
ncbi:MAG: TonB-dependent receptor [Flavobacterium sp.]|uniref:outer membrane beta-barrel family protein n=1 Tax=Flavobacterium sp. TaxID=239 RepID=UPI0025BC5B4E|nr:outer membrane beta-barrel family protein [Flavobacterium sp.]MBA4133990.1 TonB-dependent receptor [Flavobacterium sp.]